MERFLSRETQRTGKISPRSGFFRLTIGAACLVCLSLFIPPWSPSTQPAGFSLALDLDDAAGDQGVSSLDVSPDQVVSVQIFAMDIQNATGISVRFRYDGTQVAYEGFNPGEALPNAHAIVQQDTTSVRIGVSSLSGSATANAGWVGAVRFRTTRFAFSDTEVWLVHAELARGGAGGGDISRPGRRAACGRAPFAGLRRQWAGGVLGLRGLCRRLRRAGRGTGSMRRCTT